MHEETLSSREVRVGLAVLALLTVALMYVLATRIFTAPEAPPASLSVPFDEILSQEKVNREANGAPMVLPPSNRFRTPGEFATPLPSEETFEPKLKTSAPILDQYTPSLPSHLEAIPLNDPMDASAPTPLGLSPAPTPLEGISSGNIDSPIQRTAAFEPTGGEIFIPRKKQIRAGEPEILPVDFETIRPGTQYEVHAGDTLESIATSELGSATRWPEIHYLNREKYPTIKVDLLPGEILVLPMTSAKK